MKPNRNVTNPWISADIPKPYITKLKWITDDARRMPIFLRAGSGSGKSRLMGRVLAWQDFLRGVPLVIIDPHGPTIDNFLDKLLRLPRQLQTRLIHRVRYVDMSGSDGFVVPFPLYYRLGNESLYEIAQRPLDVIRKIDPHLQSASVEGWNALYRTGTNLGMILSALGLQITEAPGILNAPETLAKYFPALHSLSPELEKPVLFFRELSEAKMNIRNRRTEAFSNKFDLFSLDPVMKAMFGANLPGVNWRQVENKRIAVLLDFRHINDIERRRFMMMWCFQYLLNYIKHRGAGRHHPISLFIDELTALFSVQALAADAFASDVDELINVIARNYSLWLCIASQELYQFSERLQKTLLTMGNQIHGVSSDPDAAENLVRKFARFNPNWVKKFEPVYFSVGFPGFPTVIDYRSEEYSVEEQRILKSYDFTNLGRFRFLVRFANREGDQTGNLSLISIENFDKNQYPKREILTKARNLLMQRHGLEMANLIHEIDLRMPTNYIDLSTSKKERAYLWST